MTFGLPAGHPEIVVVAPSVIRHGRDDVVGVFVEELFQTRTRIEEAALSEPAAPTTPSPGRPCTGQLVRAFLRCTSTRFTCYYFLAFYCGLAGAGEHRPGWLALGAGYWFVHSTTTELLNRLADRAADEVNRPERTALCHLVGYRRLRLAAMVGSTLLLGLGLVWIVLVPTPLVIALVLVADVLCVNYSYGLRLSRSRFLSLIVLAFPFVGTFSGGWALAHPRLDAAAGRDFVTDALPVLVIGGLALASLSGVKDLTDMVGDHLKGYRSGWLWLVRGRTATIGAGLAALPFGALVGFVGGHALPPSHLALLVLLPAALLLAGGTRLARTGTEQMAVREFFYQYWMVFLAGLTVLHVGTWGAVGMASVVGAGWLLATRYLHWARDTGLGWLRTVLRMHVRRSDPALTFGG